METKKERPLWQKICIFVSLMGVLFLIYYFAQKEISKIYNVTDDIYTWMFQVETVDVKDGFVNIKGWAFELNKSSEYGSYEIIFHDTEKEKGYYPKMEYNNREDINDYFLCEYDYTESGFVASISAKKLNMENGVYEILIRPNGTRKAIPTNTYLANGTMMFVHPDEYIPLDVSNTDLEQVVNEGVLRVYRSDVGMYVYQYDGNLYWIAEPYYDFVDGDTCTFFQMETTQPQQLPAIRLENNWDWSDISFEFSSKELVESNTGKYRVTMCTIPTEYSITKAWTGNHINEWIWRENFRIWIDDDLLEKVNYIRNDYRCR